MVDCDMRVRVQTDGIREATIQQNFTTKYFPDIQIPLDFFVL